MCNIIKSKRLKNKFALNIVLYLFARDVENEIRVKLWCRVKVVR